MKLCRTNRTGRRLGATLAVLALALAFAAPASAAGGESTPGVTVTAQNPGTSRLGSDMTLALTAHTEESTVINPSCRPEDVTLECWGSLTLRIPEYGDLAVGNFEVHRVAVGDIGCGDEGDEAGCGGHGADAALAAPTLPVQAQVNGVGFVKWSGNTGLPVGTKLQLKFTLTDNGPARYGDQVVVQVNRFAEGPDKPLLYVSEPQLVQQVQIRYVDD